MSAPRPSIYLAGPDVFRAEAAQHGAELKRLARSFDLEGMWPLDGGSFACSTPQEKAFAIRNANLGMIEKCAGVVADISPFRGPNMDPGTAFEIGYANALRKPVFAWSCDCRSLLIRTAQAMNLVKPAGSGDARDKDGLAVEDFDLPENLMIACSVGCVFRSPGEAMLAAANALIKKPAAAIANIQPHEIQHTRKGSYRDASPDGWRRPGRGWK